MTQITLDQANAIITGGFAEAQRQGIKPLGIVVVDAGGHLIAYQRQTHASSGRFAVAMGKASGALFMGQSSRKLGVLAEAKHAFVNAIGQVAPAGIVPAAGGVIVVDTDGLPIGAVGVSGDNPDNDEICALAGITAAGLVSQD